MFGRSLPFLEDISKFAKIAIDLLLISKSQISAFPRQCLYAFQISRSILEKVRRPKTVGAGGNFLSSFSTKNEYLVPSILDVDNNNKSAKSMKVSEMIYLTIILSFIFPMKTERRGKIERVNRDAYE